MRRFKWGAPILVRRPSLGGVRVLGVRS